MHLLDEFDKMLTGACDYPFQENVTNVLSSVIRFLLKAIFCAHDFLDPLPTARCDINMPNVGKCKKPDVPIPPWYEKVGTFSVLEDLPATAQLKENKKIEVTNNAEFIPYDAAECLCFLCVVLTYALHLHCFVLLGFVQVSIQLEAFHEMKKCLENADKVDFASARQKVVAELNLNGDPAIFFAEMCQVMSHVPTAMIGQEKKKNPKTGKQTNSYGANVCNVQGKFEKYLLARWKELKNYVKEIKTTNAKKILFYLPLLDFENFLEESRQIQSDIETVSKTNVK
ncbi:hypothetical protein RFI_11124 [Reticulomyxa filosa]|uniref:Uncharacterized protein n=1 Tax=Reticulomyxa filosa TaxID=46433 RepID=X6NKW4_RETFI|nr:hypothetical protein RFI_11124 [Reticulomyxa filosa]|eukprot:ETO26017.1 hypothetical protein RFI_11124 [Reticulomyxa filosa]